jgi:hypothetical protein
MASEVYINIKDLPELSEINNGDYIVVETGTGTHILNFENLLIPTENSVITTTVNQNASAFDTYVSNISSNINELYSNTDVISSNLDILSASYEEYKSTLTEISNTKIKSGVITIKAGDYSGSIVLVTTPSYTESNISITPMNKYAALYPAYVDSFNQSTGLITIKGTFNTIEPTATFNTATSTVSVTLSTNYIAAEEDAIYNIFVIKT